MPDTILIVDDTPANLDVLLRCLSEAGHRVLVAEDGVEALELLGSAEADLVLLDVMMPGIDGFETCRRLRAIQRHRDLPVIFMTALADTREKLAGFAAGAVDYITKPIQHEEALARVATHLQIRRLQRQLATELALKEKFMRIAAHDLRNPLCLVLMASAVERKAADKPDVLHPALADIEASAKHMRSIIDTFLHLRPGDRSARLDLAVLAEAVSKQQMVAAGAKQQDIIVESASDLPPARGDSGEVFQVVTNFLSNAIKFTPRGGSIRITVGLAPGGMRLRLAVADTGPGIPESERPALFTEFSRLSPRPTEGEETHGVGLAIAKHLAEQNGGQVGADFPATGGSIFWCELPVAGM